MTTTPYPKRLIEVDLPIARISAHARREKSIRHGHISTLHIWWARRPLAACRAVILASLWPDPVDLLAGGYGSPIRPARFIDEGVKQFKRWVEKIELLERDEKVGLEFAKALRAFAKKPLLLADPAHLRGVLLDFIADFANWDNSTDPFYLETARALTQAAHECLGGEPHTRPMVIDPFAGGGSIPLEALRVGADAFASDLNPIPILLNKVVLEYIPKYGQRLADEVRKWGQWIKEEAEKDLSRFYPKEWLAPPELHGKPLLLINASKGSFGAVTTGDIEQQLALSGPYTHYVSITEGQMHGPLAMQAAWGASESTEAKLAKLKAKPLNLVAVTPIAYLWARTVISEAPIEREDKDGKPLPEEDILPVEVPLMRSLWLAKKAGRRRALRWVRHEDGPSQGKVKTQTVEVAYVEDGQRILKRVKRPVLEIFEPAKESDVEGGTVARGSATCPVTGFTTKVDRVRAQLKSRRGGAADARLFCVVTTREGEQGRFYRLPTKADQEAFDAAAAELERREKEDGTQRSQKGRKDGEGIAAGQGSRRSLVPDEVISLNELRRVSVPIYGMERWGDLFSPRQALALTTLARLVREAGERMRADLGSPALRAGSSGAAETAESAALQATGNTLRADGSTLQASRSVLQPDGGDLQTDGSVLRVARTPLRESGRGLQTTGRVAGSAHGAQSVAHGGQRASAVSPRTGGGSQETVWGGPETGGAPPQAGGAVDEGFVEAVTTVLGIAHSRFADICNSFCVWESSKNQVRHMYTRQALGMMWDYAEPGIFGDAAGNFGVTLGTMVEVLAEEARGQSHPGHIEQASATNHPLPDDAAAAFVTDPPYYDAVPYAYLSDFFYVWMRRTLADVHPSLFREGGVPKDAEIVVDRPHQLSKSTKDIAFYERELTKAFAEGRRVLAPSGVGTIVFASKTTASWEAILKAVIDAGFIITGSWPIDTEMETRVAAQGQARLGSSVHIVVRPREGGGGQVVTGKVGEWREVLAELPKEMAKWMPRLAAEGVVGADAIFACIGPALEIFSRYTRVERASGEQVTLKEYLVEVWAAVSKEALSLIMKDADTSGLEPDARLTAVWLWTVGGGKKVAAERTESTEEGGDEDEDDEEEGGKKGAVNGFALEFDAARLIAQGLGIHLEKSESIVEIKGEIARLRAVSERTKELFGTEAQDAGLAISAATAKARKKAIKNAAPLFQSEEEIKQEIIKAEVESVGKLAAERAGATVLDRVHQSMLLFAAGRGDALKRFLVEDGVGKDGRYWKLAQSLSALYPTGTDEKRWVDGVLARKKGLGF